MVDDLDVSFGGETDQAVINLVGLVVLAVHIEQHAGPDSALVEGLVETVNPKRLDEEKIQPRRDRILLDFVDEQIIRVQFMGHCEVVNAYHKRAYYLWRRP